MRTNLEEGSKKTDVRFLQWEKQERERTATDEGMTIVRIPQKWNAESSIRESVDDASKKTQSRELQKEKQDLHKVSTDAGMTIVARPEK
jgi:hypothetical protein